MIEQPFDQFYAANKGLCHKVCGKVFKRVMAMGVAVEYEDLIQEASITMMKAHAGFNPELGFRFSTYFVRAAFNDLNRFLREYGRDVEILQVCSMSQVNQDGEVGDMESFIAGPHDNPEQMLEAKQMLHGLTNNLSPLAKLILEMTMHPTEEMQAEWDKLCEMNGVGEGREMAFSFVHEYINRIEPQFSLKDLANARKELAATRKEFA